jgi:hypothetical protein
MPAVSDPTVEDQLASGVPPEPDLGGAFAENGDRMAEASDAPAALAPEPPEAAEALPERPPLLRPIPSPLPLRKRAVRGRYRSGGAGWQLELRVDVDGPRPVNRISGDFFSTSGGTTSYFGSFVVNAPAVTTTGGEVKIEGMGAFTWAAGAPFLRVTIPRVPIFRPQRPAMVQFLTPPNTPGAIYSCAFGSPYFRTVEWEQDSVAGAVPFVSYDTGTLPQPSSSPARALTVSKAFGEAGLEMLAAGTPNVIPVSAAGAGPSPTWSDSELHNAMDNHFSLFADTPQWRVWMLVATTHDDGYRGIMFDAGGAFQRQGAAVFYDAIQGNDPESQRAQLRTYVHELGHAFNLLHSWQKNLADPPAPLGPNGGLGDLSWMNYAWRYQPPAPDPGGEAAYWASFPFHFTDNELIHLRHGLYRNVIMGGDPFGKGAADIDPEVFAAPLEDNSGLALELRTDRDAFAYGEPVVVELKLSATDLRGRATHGYLHPKDEFVSLAIRQPSGRVVLYRPILFRCADHDRSVRLDPGQPAIYESAYIGFGREGFYFEQPGRYEVRAQYVATDGSRIVSPVLALRVRAPGSAEDERVAELLLGEEQGQILTLLGSDARHLSRGNEALETLIEEHGTHPLATYARLVKGVNCARQFKDITPDKRLLVRDPQPEEASALLSSVAEASAGDGGVDNITLNMAMRRQALAEGRAGRADQGRQVLDEMVSIFEGKGLNPHVLDLVRRQAEETVRDIAGDSENGG